MMAQVAGGFAGGAIVWIFYMPHWSRTEDKIAKRSVFCTTPAIRSYLNNMISEMTGTAVLIFSLLFIGTHTFTEGLNPLVVGALIMLIGFALGGTTGYAINPARDLGPRLAHFTMPIKGKGDSDWAYSWVPIVGPFLGSLLGASAYQILYKNDFQLKYIVVVALVAVVLIAAVLGNRKETPALNAEQTESHE